MTQINSRMLKPEPIKCSSCTHRFSKLYCMPCKSCIFTKNLPSYKMDIRITNTKIDSFIPVIRCTYPEICPFDKVDCQKCLYYSSPEIEKSKTKFDDGDLYGQP